VALGQLVIETLGFGEVAAPAAAHKSLR